MSQDGLEQPQQLTVGLYGKLPAHGDFVERGWCPATIAALDHWITEGIAAVAAGLDHDALAAQMTAAPLWYAYAPPGWAGPNALHFVLSPSIDRAGRYFLLLCGVEGNVDAVWALASHQSSFAEAAAATVYDALGGGLDADAIIAKLEADVRVPDPKTVFRAGLAQPSAAIFWIEEPPMALRANVPDSGTIVGLLAAT